MDHSGTRLLYAGIVLFALVTGFLAGTNNSSVLTASLFAAIPAIGGVLTFIQNLRPKMGPDGVQRMDAPPSPSQGNTLGLMLVCLSLGFATGLGIGIWVHTNHPWILGEKVRVTVPWMAGADSTSPHRLPDTFDEATGWLAVSERLRSLGLSDEDVRHVYASFRNDPEVRKKVELLGSRWTELNLKKP